MKLIDLISARRTVEELAPNGELPFSVAYRIAKFLSLTQTDNAFFEERMKGIITKHLDRVDDGNIFIKKDEIEEYNSEVEELQNMEVSAPDIKFQLNKLDGIVKLSPAQILSLLEFIEE